MSKQAAASTFSSSPAKDYLRSEVDRAVLEDFRRRLYPSQRLAYLGLPGAALLDILSWREHIGSCTAIENTGAAGALERTVLKNHLESVVQLIFGNIDDLLLNNDSRLRFPYQLVNLDYTGGLVHRQKNRTSRRLDAIKQLFAKQKGTAFLLLLTVNLRDRDFDELDDLVEQQEEDLLALDLQGVRECFECHRELNHAGLLKMYVPLFLDRHAVHHSLVFIPPTLYQGTKQMIHFAVECVPYTTLGAGRMSTTQQRIQLLNLPLLSLHGYGTLQRIDLGCIQQ